MPETTASELEPSSPAEAHPPGEALALWLRRFTRFIAAKRGLAQALHSGDPAFQALPDYFRQNFEPALAGLLDAAVKAGAVGAGFTFIGDCHITVAVVRSSHSRADHCRQRDFAIS